jgi:carotenoid cleavage dioxygenase-like enzyme
LKVKALNNLKPEGSYVHGVSFHMTEAGDVLLFDSKNDIVKTATPEEVSTSIHGAWAAYEFQIGV